MKLQPAGFLLFAACVLHPTAALAYEQPLPAADEELVWCANDWIQATHTPFRWIVQQPGQLQLKSCLYDLTDGRGMFWEPFDGMHDCGGRRWNIVRYSERNFKDNESCMDHCYTCIRKAIEWGQPSSECTYHPPGDPSGGCWVSYEAP